jgi:hypothetical protein
MLHNRDLEGSAEPMHKNKIYLNNCNTFSSVLFGVKSLGQTSTYIGTLGVVQNIISFQSIYVGICIHMNKGMNKCMYSLEPED